MNNLKTKIIFEDCRNSSAECEIDLFYVLGFNFADMKVVKTLQKKQVFDVCGIFSLNFFSCK